LTIERAKNFRSNIVFWLKYGSNLLENDDILWLETEVFVGLEEGLGGRHGAGWTTATAINSQLLPNQRGGGMDSIPRKSTMNWEKSSALFIKIIHQFDSVCQNNNLIVYKCA
jgi:hypothetical protein